MENETSGMNTVERNGFFWQGEVEHLVDSHREAGLHVLDEKGKSNKQTRDCDSKGQRKRKS